MSSGTHAPRSATAGLVPLRSRLAAALRSRAAPWTALAVLVIGTGALLYHETRGTTVWFDEWLWLLHRRPDTLGSFLDTHNGHLSLIPVAIYKLLWATAGIRNYAPYRLLVIVAHLVTCVLLFVYARRRVGPFLAPLAAGLLLLFGPGWENLLWPFQITWLLSLGAGLGALLALDRGDRTGDVIACVLLAVSLASSGIGVPVLLGVAVELALARRRLRDAWIVAVPLLLYALWSIGYQHTTFQRHAIVAAPNFVYNAASATLSALAGLGGSTGQDGPGTLMTWGPMLLIVALAALGWRLARIGRLEPRVGALATMALSFWLLTALNRSFISTPFASRYLYVGALFVLLLAIELMRGVALTRWAGWGVGIAAVAAILSNVGALRDAARLLRDNGQTTSADLGALEIARPVMPAGYLAQQIPGYPFVMLPAAAYFAAERSVGTPAATPAQIATDPETARTAVDTELIHIHRLALVATGPRLTLGQAPAVDALRAGTTAIRGACAGFAADRVIPVGATAALAVTVPASGLALQAIGAPAVVGVRRFADTFQALGTLAPGGRVTLAARMDRSPRPWHVQIVSSGRVLACGLR
jgi:hypothetical protein